MTEQELQQFRELLPFYVNQTLSKTDNAFVEKWLNINPKLQEEIDFTKHLKTTVISVGDHRNATTGLDNLLQTLNKSPFQKKVSWLIKLNGFLAKQATPVFATLSMLIIIQSFFLVSPYINKPSVRVIADSSRSFLSSPTPLQVKLTINPSSNFGTIVVLLQKTGTRIVNGPSESGEIWIEFSSQTHLKKMIKRIQSSPAIIDVMVIKQALL